MQRALLRCAVALLFLSGGACAGRSAESAGKQDPGGTDVASISTAPAPPDTPTSQPHTRNERALVPPPTATTPPVDADAGPAASRPLIVVIDPGHNGRNSAHSTEIARQVDAGGFTKPCNTTGTSSPTMSEAEFDWLLAQELTRLLSDAGVQAILTRGDNDGWGPCIDDRGLTALRSGADLLVSLHADGAKPSVGGFHVIHPAQGATVSPEIAARSADLAAALRDQLVAEGLTPADYIGTKGLIERADLGTLNRAGVPAAMIECGNMHSASDAALLESAEGRHRIASAIAATLVEWQQ